MAHETVRPRIIGADYTVEPVTMTCEYDLPWNRQSDQTACGTMIQNQVGAKDWRVTVTGILTRPQLVKLARMRDEDAVTLVTEEFGEISVAFDNLNIRRESKDAVGHIEGYEGPILHFSLQTKENDENDEGIEFFNENTRGSGN